MTGPDPEGPRKVGLQVAAASVAIALLALAVVASRDDGPVEPQASPTTVTTLSEGGVPAPDRPPSTVPIAADPQVTATREATSAELGGLAFTDDTADAGLGAPRSDRDTVGANDMAGGAAAADYDDDGDVDLFVTRVGEPDALYQNDGTGRFKDVAAAAGIDAASIAGHAGAAWADVDGDRDLDLWVTTAGPGDNVLWINDGQGRFADATRERGLALPADADDSRTFSSTFHDWDRDGDLDLLVLEWYVMSIQEGREASSGDGPLADDPVFATQDQCARAAALAAAGWPTTPGARAPRTRLYANDGTGRFDDVTAASGIDTTAIAGFTATFTDLDDDGWDDLLVAGDFCTSRVYRNVAGRRFEEVTEAVGVGTDENAMGSAVEDLDGDGDMDWFVTGIFHPGRTATTCPTEASTTGCSGNRLYENTGDGTFRDATDRLGVRDAFWGWGAVGQDMNNDGRRDLLAASGFLLASITDFDFARPDERLPRRSHGSGPRLWLGAGAAPWPEVAAQVGLTHLGNAKAALPIDVDGDGDLDLFLANTEGEPVLYRNETPTGASWIGMQLDDPTVPNHAGIGARVTTVASDGTRRVGEVRAGGGFQAGEPPTVHHGLGAADGPVTVLVQWPDSRIVERFADVVPGAVALLRRGDGVAA